MVVGREITLIIFKVENEIQAYCDKANCVMYNNLKYRINKYVKKKEPSRCVNCQLKTEQTYSNSNKSYISLKKCSYLGQKLEKTLTSAKYFAPF